MLECPDVLDDTPYILLFVGCLTHFLLLLHLFTDTDLLGIFSCFGYLWRAIKLCCTSSLTLHIEMSENLLLDEDVPTCIRIDDFPPWYSSFVANGEYVLREYFQGYPIYDGPEIWGQKIVLWFQNGIWMLTLEDFIFNDDLRYVYGWIEWSGKDITQCSQKFNVLYTQRRPVGKNEYHAKVKKETHKLEVITVLETTDDLADINSITGLYELPPLDLDDDFEAPVYKKDALVHRNGMRDKRLGIRTSTLENYISIWKSRNRWFLGYEFVRQYWDEDEDLSLHAEYDPNIFAFSNQCSNKYISDDTILEWKMLICTYRQLKLQIYKLDNGFFQRRKLYCKQFLSLFLTLVFFVQMACDIFRLIQTLDFKNIWNSYECFVFIILTSPNMKLTTTLLIFRFLPSWPLLYRSTIQSSKLLNMFSYMYLPFIIPCLFSHILPGMLVYFWFWFVIIFFCHFIDSIWQSCTTHWWIQMHCFDKWECKGIRFLISPTFFMFLPGFFIISSFLAIDFYHEDFYYWKNFSDILRSHYLTHLSCWPKSTLLFSRVYWWL